MQCRPLVSLTTWFAIPAYEVLKPRRWWLQHPEPSKQYPALNTGKLPLIILEPGPPYNRISVLISICQTSVRGGWGANSKVNGYKWETLELDSLFCRTWQLPIQAIISWPSLSTTSDYRKPSAFVLWCKGDGNGNLGSPGAVHPFQGCKLAQPPRSAGLVSPRNAQ